MADCINKKKVSVNLKTGEKRTIMADCGKCYNCQTKKKRSNIKVFSEEMKEYKYSIFLTLTYEPEHIPLIEFKDRLENNIYELSQKNHEIYREIIKKYKSIDNLYKTIIDTIHNYKAIKTNDFYEKLKAERERVKHNLLVSKYGTLKYCHLLEYLNNITREMRRRKYLKKNKNRKDDFNYCYIGCGEYPNIKKNRGRPHYHLLIGFNELELIKYFIKYWKYGNIGIERGENQWEGITNELINFYAKMKNEAMIFELTRYLYKKLDCVITQENKDEDIKRIYKYIDEGRLILNSNKRASNIAYIVAYTHKKTEASQIKANYDIKRDIFDYYKTQEENGTDYKETRKILKEYKKTYKEYRRDKDYIFKFKEEPFVCKTKNAGNKYLIENWDKLVDEQLEYYYDSNNNYKAILINDIFHNRIKRIMLKENNKIENEIKKTDDFNIKLELNKMLATEHKYIIERANYNKYIEKRNEIINSMKINELEQIKKHNKDFEYTINYKKDGSTDIYDYSNKDIIDYSIIQKHKADYTKLKELEREYKELQANKTYKSDIFVEYGIEEMNRYLNIIDKEHKNGDFLYCEFVLSI